MKIFLSKQFYQRYFSAVRRQHADWLGWVPEQTRLAMLAHLTQWDIKSMTDKQYREHL
ncbi:glucose uptake inhibitor SgrT [Serratia quinivorans]|uniref:glucose uptake inhibitor SgrT n=1 Tax=Serratia quinivorans TaxID=137545 RepID=UPI003F9B8781